MGLSPGGALREDLRTTQSPAPDCCLMAADYSSALRLYQEAEAAYRLLGDGVWEAACLEGQCSAAFLLNGAAAVEEEVQVAPIVLYCVLG